MRRRSTIGCAARGVASALTVAVVLVTASGACASQRADDAERIGYEEVRDRHLDAMVRVLGFDDDQASALESLREGLRTAWVRALELHEDELEEALDAVDEDDDDWGAEADIEERMEARLEARQNALIADFYDDVRLLLTPEQAERWERWEFVRVRLDELPKSVYPGDQIDLDALYRELAPGRPDANVQGALDTYTRTLHDLLIERATQRRKAHDTLSGMDAYDASDVESITGPARRSAWAVAQYNRDSAERIAEQMSEAAGEVFLRTYRERARPGLYTNSSSITLIDALRDLDTITPEQVSELDAIERAYRRDRASAIAEARLALIEAEREHALGSTIPSSLSSYFRVLTVEGPRGRRPMRLSNERVMGTQQRLSAMDSETRQAALAVLTQEQRTRVRNSGVRRGAPPTPPR